MFESPCPSTRGVVVVIADAVLNQRWPLYCDKKLYRLMDRTRGHSPRVKVRILLQFKFNGEVAERSIAAVLKTVGRVERPLGSNPSLSARGNLTAILSRTRLLI